MANKLLWSGRYGGLSASVYMIGDSPRAFLSGQMAFGEDELGILRRAVVIASEQATRKMAVFSHEKCRGVYHAVSSEAATAFIYGISVGEQSLADGEGLSALRDTARTYALSDAADVEKMRTDQESIFEGEDDEAAVALSLKGWQICQLGSNECAPVRCSPKTDSDRYEEP